MLDTNAKDIRHCLKLFTFENKVPNIYIYIYIYIYIWYSFSLRFHIESWPEWDSNPRPRAYHAHVLTTELSGQTMRCA